MCLELPEPCSPISPHSLPTASLALGIVLLQAGALFGRGAQSMQLSRTKVLTSGLLSCRAFSTSEKEADPQWKLPSASPQHVRMPVLKIVQFL